MRLAHSAALAAALCLASVPLRAQMCLGTPPFGAGWARVGVDGRLGESSSSLGGGVAVGEPQGLFAGADVARQRLETFDRTLASTSFAGNVGYTLKVTPANTSAVCPIVSVASVRGPSFSEDGAEVEMSSRRLGGGVAVGGRVARSPLRIPIIPFGSLLYYRETATVRVADDAGSQHARASSTYGYITVGAGLVFRRTLTLQPSVRVGTEDGELSAGLALAYNFGS